MVIITMRYNKVRGEIMRQKYFENNESDNILVNCDHNNIQSVVATYNNSSPGADDICPFYAHSFTVHNLPFSAKSTRLKL